VFRNSSDAQAAADELKANGFTDNEIYLSSYTASGTAGATSTRETGTGGYQGTSHHEGGIKGWFKSLFGEDDEQTDRSYYESAVNSGNVLLSVNVDDQNLDTAVDILDKHNPLNVDRDASAAAATDTTTSSAAAAGASRTSSAGGSRRQSSKGASADLPKSIPVVQEDVRVGKRAVVRGGVRVYSRVVEQPVEENVVLQEEHVRVERQPVNRPVESGDLQAGRDEVIEVQEFAEEPVVSKQARVVEEVRISKDASERTETVRDKVRRTEVNVENLNEANAGATTSSGSFDDDFRSDFQSRYGSSGGNYEDYGPAYEYGYQSASDPRYQGRSWEQVESDLRTDYGRRYPNSAWERMKDAIRYGWDKVTGRAKSASSSR
jgi:stress response protein YsnF